MSEMDPNKRDETDESYAENTPLTELLGESARVRIISTFVGKRNRELNISQIARWSGAARKTVYEHIDDLEDLGVIESYDDEGQTRYTLADSDVASKLWELDGLTLQRL
jgi:DNA-binding transcriptional ArsR family regulator